MITQTKRKRRTALAEDLAVGRPRLLCNEIILASDIANFLQLFAVQISFAGPSIWGKKTLDDIKFQMNLSCPLILIFG
jgi:hypothetical protein